MSATRMMLELSVYDDSGMSSHSCDILPNVVDSILAGASVEEMRLMLEPFYSAILAEVAGRSTPYKKPNTTGMPDVARELVDIAYEHCDLWVVEPNSLPESNKS